MLRGVDQGTASRLPGVPLPPILTVTNIAERWGISRQATLKRLQVRGILEGRTQTAGAFLFTLAEVEAIEAAHDIVPRDDEAPGSD